MPVTAFTQPPPSINYRELKTAAVSLKRSTTSWNIIHILAEYRRWKKTHALLKANPWTRITGHYCSQFSHPTTAEPRCTGRLGRNWSGTIKEASSMPEAMCNVEPFPCLHYGQFPVESNSSILNCLALAGTAVTKRPAQHPMGQQVNADLFTISRQHCFVTGNCLNMGWATSCKPKVSVYRECIRQSVCQEHPQHGTCCMKPVPCSILPSHLLLRDVRTADSELMGWDGTLTSISWMEGRLYTQCTPPPNFVLRNPNRTNTN